MFNPDIQSDMSLYNLVQTPDGLVGLNPKHLKGIFWNASYQAMLAQKGITTNDRALVFIPASIVVEGRIYTDPEHYLAMDEASREGFWTLQKGDIIINQLVMQTITKTSELTQKYGKDNVFTVTNIAKNFFGQKVMHHFEVIAR